MRVDAGVDPKTAEAAAGTEVEEVEQSLEDVAPVGSEPMTTEAVATEPAPAKTKGKGKSTRASDNL